MIRDPLFNIPGRPDSSVTGSQFVSSLEKDGVGHGPEREERILKEVLSGNMPDFMRIVRPVPIGNARIYVLPDYLCVGSDEDYVYVPINPMTFQAVCDAFGAVMPTRKMVDAIWKAATVKVPPRPMGPPRYDYGADMLSTPRFATHSEWCRSSIQEAMKKSGSRPGELTAGHKKDVIICRSVQAPANKKVAIYGWHQLNGKPIQGPGIQDKAHEITYGDYAHGERLVSLLCEVDGQRRDTVEILKSPLLAKILSDEVPPHIENPRYVLTA